MVPDTDHRDEGKQHANRDEDGETERHAVAESRSRGTDRPLGR
jgi:hypothetical protein